ncbi:MAG: OmpA family protein [Gammaproteobacteria bacterium]|nr:OmpA family protein [Gammaproteobacteria bacterium]
MIATTSRTAVILLGISGQIILTALFMWRFVPIVENELVTVSETALRQADMTWARVSADGRDLTLSGLAPSTQLKNQAARIVADVAGVRTVGNNLLIARAGANELDAAEVDRRAREMLADIEDTAPVFATDLPYELHLQITAGVLTISGLVPDGIGKDSLLNIANREFGEGRLIDRLIIAPGAPDGYLTAATRAVEAASALDEGFIGVTNDEVYVQGVTSNASAADRLKAILEEDLPANYTSRIQTGAQSDLAQILRTYPELAQRVGVFGDSGVDSTTVETISVGNRSADLDIDDTTNTGSIMSHSRCQKAFDELLEDRSIGFATGSSIIDGDSLSLVADLVVIAKRCPDTRIEIQGHTDDLGTAKNNLRLSQQRAEAIMEYFVKNGVSLSRLSAVGYGEEQPRVENTTAEMRRINRRIEFKIIDES